MLRSIFYMWSIGCRASFYYGVPVAVSILGISTDDSSSTAMSSLPNGGFSLIVGSVDGSTWGDPDAEDASDSLEASGALLSVEAVVSNWSSVLSVDDKSVVASSSTLWIQ